MVFENKKTLILMNDKNKKDLIEGGSNVPSTENLHVTTDGVSLPDNQGPAEKTELGYFPTYPTIKGF